VEVRIPATNQGHHSPIIDRYTDIDTGQDHVGLSLPPDLTGGIIRASLEGPLRKQGFSGVRASFLPSVFRYFRQGKTCVGEKNGIPGSPYLCPSGVAIQDDPACSARVNGAPPGCPSCLVHGGVSHVGVERTDGLGWASRLRPHRVNRLEPPAGEPGSSSFLECERHVYSRRGGPGPMPHQSLRLPRRGGGRPNRSRWGCRALSPG